jgi:hypothetical protein
MTPYEQMTYNYPWATTAADSALIPFDVRVNGGLFQWGRKDFRHAFRCQKVDGVNDEMFSNTRLDYPNDPDDGKFVRSNGVNDNWLVTQQDNFWDFSQSGYTGKEDPCPAGFHVPSTAQWERLSPYNNKVYYGTGDATGYKYVQIPVQNGVWNTSYPTNALQIAYYSYQTHCGIAIYTVAAYNDIINKGNGTDLKDPASFAGTHHKPLLYLPASGFRDPSGAHYYTGNTGRYWHSSTTESQMRHTNTYSSGINPYNTSIRNTGESVRCVAK